MITCSYCQTRSTTTTPPHDLTWYFSSEVYDQAWQLLLAVCGPLSRSSGCCHDETNSEKVPLSEPSRLKKTDIYLPLWRAVWAPQHWLPIVSSSPSYASFYSVSYSLSYVEKLASPGLFPKSPSEITLYFVMRALRPWQSSIGHIWIIHRGWSPKTSKLQAN